MSLLGLTKMQSHVEGLDQCINRRADEQQRQVVKGIHPDPSCSKYSLADVFRRHCG